MEQSPIHKIFYKNNFIYVKRDDLLPFSFGGNKVRIAKEFLDDMVMQGKNCMIGYGNARSNLSRALANICASRQIECHIVSPADEDGTFVHTFNEQMSSICNACFHYCSKDDVSNTLKNVIECCEKKGLRPYYINGDIWGKGNEDVPVRAYFKVFPEIQSYEQNEKIVFDYIFLPVGTGMTQAGLLCGAINESDETPIIGISIARNAEKEKDILRNYDSIFMQKNKISKSFDDSQIIVDDSYLCGGYGKYDENVESIIDDVFVKFGIPLDANYSGKAFYGMTDYLLSRKISGKKILFLHTGGTALFFDMLANRRNLLSGI